MYIVFHIRKQRAHCMPPNSVQVGVQGGPAFAARQHAWQRSRHPLEPSADPLPLEGNRYNPGVVSPPSCDAFGDPL